MRWYDLSNLRVSCGQGPSEASGQKLSCSPLSPSSKPRSLQGVSGGDSPGITAERPGRGHRRDQVAEVAWTWGPSPSSIRAGQLSVAFHHTVFYCVTCHPKNLNWYDISPANIYGATAMHQLLPDGVGRCLSEAKTQCHRQTSA